MEIQCKDCNKRFVIPEQKLPQKDTFHVLCPQCQKRISVSLRKKAEGRGEEREEVSFTNEVSEEMYSDVPRAMVCEDESSYRAPVQEALESLGYKTLLVKSPEEALERIKFVQYEIILVNEAFGGGSSSNNGFLGYLQNMAVSARRNIFFVLYGKSFKTMDNFMAFVKSANLVINLNDLSNLEYILKRAIDDNKRFYRIFKDYLRKLGKL